MLIPKTKPARDEKFRRWIASLPCCITGLIGQSQCAHIKRLGMGIKSSDYRTLPLSWQKHAEQHACGDEAKFWAKYGKTMEDVDALANALHLCQYDDKAAYRILQHFKKGMPCCS